MRTKQIMEKIYLKGWEMLPPANWKIDVTIPFWNARSQWHPRVKFGLHFSRQKAKILLEPTHPGPETSLFSRGELKFEGIMLLSWTLDISLAGTVPSRSTHIHKHFDNDAVFWNIPWMIQCNTHPARTALRPLLLIFLTAFQQSPVFHLTQFWACHKIKANCQHIIEWTKVKKYPNNNN